jgi:putative membrane protein
MVGSSVVKDMRKARVPRLHWALLGWYVLFWVVTAISPHDRGDWLLENLLALGLVGLLVATYRYFRLSDLSYILITVFLTLHTIGAHYTYSEVPLGFWLKEWLVLSRNHFDRIVHFAFGLLLAYPLREVLMRKGGLRDPWSFVVAIATVQAGSDLFEIIESWVALIVSPDLGNAYLGTQGDQWDAQKDMTAAFVGGVLAMVTAAFLVKFRRVNSPPRPAAQPIQKVRA